MAKLIDKFRPTLFSSLVGQEQPLALLKNILSKKLFTTHKEYIFYSPVGGVGKTSLALSFAQSINCDTNNSCGTCKSCKQFKNGTSPDFISVNGADFATTEKVKALSQIANTMPTKGKMRVIILDEFQRVSKTAQSEFLELLEFAKNNTIWIFTTTNLDSILSPLRTRCLEVAFLPLSPPEVKKGLLDIVKSEGLSIDESVLNVIARVCKGSMREAIKLLDVASFSETSVQFISDSPIFSICEALLDDRDDLAESIVYRIDLTSAVSSILSDLHTFYRGDLSSLTQDSKKREVWAYSLSGYIEPLIKNFLTYKPDTPDGILLTARLSLSLKQKPLQVIQTSTSFDSTSLLTKFGFSKDS